MTVFGDLALAASRRDAATRLAALLTVETGVVVSPEQMLKFILGNWDRVAAFAHQIHGTEARPNPSSEPEPEPHNGLKAGCDVTKEETR